MIHARSQIRNAVTTLLKNNSSVGNNVFESRVYPLSKPKLPAVLVYTKNESVGDKSISYPRTQNRELSLTIEVYVKSSNNIDEEADNLALEIEQILSNNINLSGLVKDLSLSSTEIQYSDEGEKPIGILVMNYNILYCVKENNPQTAI